MKTLTCLENIIGITRKNCPCFEDGKPSDYNTSKSGLFLDELDGLELRMIDADLECGEDDIWSKAERAIENAKLKYRADIMRCIGGMTSVKRKTYYGVIGQKLFRGDVNLTTSKLGLRIMPGNIKGGEFTLNGIGTLMNANATFDVELWSNYSSTPLETFRDINSVADKYEENKLENPVTYPLYNQDCDDDLEYYLVFTPSGFLPKDSKVSCGCSKRLIWEQWADVQGVRGDDTGEIDLWISDSQNNGILPDIQFNCNSAELICGGDNVEVDYDNDEVALSMAYAIRYEAGRALIDDILGSGNINRYTLLNNESLWSLRNEYFEKFEELVGYNCQETDITLNDCLKCSDKYMGKGAILS